ncbi:KEOPS complex subunit Pcc1 [Natrinema halophilum]|uniref:KEOPS complex Pcc1-like subunit n=1 Tax=Natrinema halophilum TaxID=1699371 RepID=A0A7D5KQH5_9EURY|nr:KEOPS complex subunit Pcc1 [Natrinema halophilum]QLG47404.1 KEOPS complex Pcc1-like subunit [Natrinema halophilum]
MASHDATLEFDFDSESRAQLVTESVARETGEIDDDRSRTSLDRDGRQLVIEIDADDIVALRAALNTWFSLVDVAERIADTGTSAFEDEAR